MQVVLLSIMTFVMWLFGSQIQIQIQTMLAWWVIWPETWRPEPLAPWTNMVLRCIDNPGLTPRWSSRLLGLPSKTGSWAKPVHMQGHWIMMMLLRMRVIRMFKDIPYKINFIVLHKLHFLILHNHHWCCKICFQETGLWLFLIIIISSIQCTFMS